MFKLVFILIFIFNTINTMTAQNLNYRFSDVLVLPNPSLSGLSINDICLFRNNLFIAAESQSSSMGSRSFINIISSDHEINQVPLKNELRFGGGNFKIIEDKLYFRGKYYEPYQNIDTTITFEINEHGIVSEAGHIFDIVFKDWFPNVPIDYDLNNNLSILNPNLIHHATFPLSDSSGISIFTTGNLNLKLLPFIKKFRDVHKSIVIGFYEKTPIKTIYLRDFDDPYKYFDLTPENPFITLSYFASNLENHELKSIKLCLIDTANKEKTYLLSPNDVSEADLKFKIPDNIPSGNFQYFLIHDNSIPINETFYFKLNNDLGYKNYLNRKANWILIPFIVCTIGVIVCLSLLAYHTSYQNESWNYFSRWDIGIRSGILVIVSLILMGFAWDWIKFLLDKAR